MKKLFLILALVASCAEPAFAQTLAQLSAKVDTLNAVIGDYTRVIPCSELDANRPALILGDGGYPERFRLKQIGCAIDAAVQLVGGFQAQVSGLAARIAAIESKVAGGQPVGTAVFDKIRANRVCIGDYDCDDDWTAQLQIRGNYDANIGVESNKAGLQSQSPRPHMGQWSLSTDGGMRSQQNCKGTVSRGYFCYVDPCREGVNVGNDSRGSWSYWRGSVDERANPFDGTNCTPIPHDATQDFVITTNEATKEVNLFLWRPLWKLVPIGSTTLRGMEIKYTIPQQ